MPASVGRLTVLGAVPIYGATFERRVYQRVRRHIQNSNHFGVSLVCSFKIGSRSLMPAASPFKRASVSSITDRVPLEQDAVERAEALG